jgi:hypothetical protein
MIHLQAVLQQEGIILSAASSTAVFNRGIRADSAASALKKKAL